MHCQAQRWRSPANNGGNFSKRSRGHEHQHVQQPSRQAGRSAPLHGADETQSRPLGLTMNGIGFGEKSHAQSVDHRIEQPNDQACHYISDERPELRAGVNVGPIQRLSKQQRQDGQRSQEPPEDSIGHAPRHAGAVPAQIALEQYAEAGADDGSEQIVKRVAQYIRCGPHKARDH